MDPDRQRTAVMISAAVAVIGAIIWLVLVAIGFSAFAKARKPTAGPGEPPLPISNLAVAAAATSLGSAFLGPFVVLGQLVAAVLAVLALRGANEPSRTLSRWVLVWAATMLTIVAAVAGITLAAYL